MNEDAQNGLPQGWAVAAVGDAIPNIQPGFASGEHNSEGRGIIHLRPMNIDRQGRLDLSAVKFVSPESRLRVSPGDVLFNNTNSPELVGKTTSISSDAEFAFSNHMTRLRPTADMSSEFVAFQLHFLWMTGYFRHRCTHHVNQASIASQTLAETVPLLIAPIPEQRRIVAEVDRRLSVIDELEATLEANLRRAAGLRQAILKRAFKGKLVPQDPSDEPASLLLERIQAERATKQAAERPTPKRTPKRRKTVAGKTRRLFPDP